MIETGSTSAEATVDRSTPVDATVDKPVPTVLQWFRRHVTFGRKRVRDALYMAALAAARSRSVFRTIYDKLRQAGKPPKLALIAVARRLLVTLNAMVRDQRPFQIA